MNEPIYYSAGPCQTCNYGRHCSGRRDAITGVSGYPDSCREYDEYYGTDVGRKRQSFERIPHRVAGAQQLRIA